MKLYGLFIWSAVWFTGIFALRAQRHFWRIQASYGFSAAHHQNMYGLTGRLTRGFSFYYGKHFRRGYYEKLWNYPDLGLYVQYYDLGDRRLGNITSLWVSGSFYLNRRNSRHHILLDLSEGFGYVSNPYDKSRNPQNMILGSHFTSTMSVAMRYRFDWRHWSMETAVGIRHFSNGNFKAPNAGINCPEISVGIIPRHRPNDYEPSAPDHHPFHPSRYWRIFFRTGLNETDVPGMGKFPFFIPGVEYVRHFHPKHAWRAGAELMINYSLKEWIAYQQIAYNAYPSGKPSFWRAGVFGGHLFDFGMLGISTDLGVYVYNPSHFVAPWYFRLGTQLRLGRKWFLTYSVKLHYFMAEELEWTLHYRL